MADNQEKKSFYALNLTEGRMFGMFIGIVLVLVAIFFIILVATFKNSKPKNRIITRNIEKNEANQTNNQDSLSFYTNEESDKVSIKEDDVLSKQVISLNQNNIFTEDKTKNNSDVSGVNESADEVAEVPQLSIDNSEVLYSSKYQKNTKFKKEVVQDAQASVNVASEKPKTQQSVKNDTTSSPKVNTQPQQVKTENKDNVRYVVQVGSYTNKKIADEITLHYSKVGYPVYQQEFDKDGKKFYRLRVGPFKEKDRAENYLLSVKESKYGKNSYISKIFI